MPSTAAPTVPPSSARDVSINLNVTGLYVSLERKEKEREAQEIEKARKREEKRAGGNRKGKSRRRRCKNKNQNRSAPAVHDDPSTSGHSTDSEATLTTPDVVKDFKNVAAKFLAADVSYVKGIDNTDNTVEPADIAGSDDDEDKENRLVAVAGSQVVVSAPGVLNSIDNFAPNANEVGEGEFGSIIPSQRMTTFGAFRLRTPHVRGRTPLGDLNVSSLAPEQTVVHPRAQVAPRQVGSPYVVPPINTDTPRPPMGFKFNPWADEDSYNASTPYDAGRSSAPVAHNINRGVTTILVRGYMTEVVEVQRRKAYPNSPWYTIDAAIEYVERRSEMLTAVRSTIAIASPRPIAPFRFSAARGALEMLAQGLDAD